MPVLYRCLRQLRRGMRIAWPAEDAAYSTAAGSAAASAARRGSAPSSSPSGPPSSGEAKEGNLSLIAAAAVLGGVLAWGYASRRSGLPQRYVEPNEEGAGQALARDTRALAQNTEGTVPTIGSFEAIDEHGKVVTDETLLDHGDFLLLLIHPGERFDYDDAPIKEFAQINDAVGCMVSAAKCCPASGSGGNGIGPTAARHLCATVHIAYTLCTPAMESLMAWRLIRPVIMAPNVRPDADGLKAIKQAVEVYRETLKSAFRRRSKHAIHGLIGGDTARVAERAKAYAASANGADFAAETDRRPTLYVVDPKGAFKHAWMLQVRPMEVWKVSALVEEIIEYNL